MAGMTGINQFRLSKPTELPGVLSEGFGSPAPCQAKTAIAAPPAAVAEGASRDWDDRSDTRRALVTGRRGRSWPLPCSRQLREGVWGARAGYCAVRAFLARSTISVGIEYNSSICF